MSEITVEMENLIFTLQFGPFFASNSFNFLIDSLFYFIHSRSGFNVQRAIAQLYISLTITEHSIYCVH